MRGSERLMIVGFAGLAIWLGYKLFEKAASESGELLAKHQQSTLQLKRIGPGVFFALFGVSVLGFSLVKPIETKINDQTTGIEIRQFSGPGQLVTNSEEAIRLIVSINQIKFFADARRTPTSEEEWTQYLVAVSELVSFRPRFVNAIYERDVMTQWNDWRKSAQSDPSFESKLSEADRKLYKAIQDMLETGR